MMRSFARGTKAALAIEVGCGSVRSALLFFGKNTEKIKKFFYNDILCPCKSV